MSRVRKTCEEEGRTQHTIEGSVVDELNAPYPGLLAVAEKVSDGDRIELASAFTDSRGCYVLDAADEPLDAIRVAIRDPDGIRSFAHVGPILDARQSPLRFPAVTVARSLAAGWTAPLDPDRAWGFTRQNAVEPLVDGAFFEAVARAVQGARVSLNMVQLMFTSQFSARFEDMEDVQRGSPRRRFRRALDTGRANRLLDDLLAADRRGVRVCLLLNQSPIMDDYFGEIQEALVDVDHGMLVRAFPTAPNTLHAKLLVVDGREAFIMGPPFEQQFFDTRDHLVPDVRRGRRGLPHHDVSLRVEGPAVHTVDAFFARLWNHRTNDSGGTGDVVTPAPRGGPAGDVSLQVVGTIPAGLLPDCPSGEYAIRESYLAAFQKASRFVYLENQYFTSGRITRTLRRLLDVRPEVEVVIVLNEAVDIPTYVAWQKRRLGELGYPERENLGVFTLRTVRRPGLGRIFGRDNPQLYVHSKVGIVDDRWATVGTANLDSISLEAANEFGVEIEANVDLNASILDGVAGEPETGVVRSLRERLWTEHTGLDAEGLEREIAIRGVVGAWRHVAEENARRIARGESDLVGRIVPYDARPQGHERFFAKTRMHPRHARGA